MLSIPFVLFVAVSSCVLTLAISRYFYARRLKDMRLVTDALSKGDFKGRLNMSASDEWGDLARGINQMSEEFQKKIRQVIADKDQLKAILSSMVEGVIIVSGDSHVVHISPNFYNMLEVRSKEPNGRYYWEVIWNASINDLLREALASKKALRQEIAILHPVETFFSMQISPVLDERGALSSVVAVFHDITELKKYERLRSEFVANVSHELKTPLTSIKGFVETLKEGALDDHDHALRFLDIIGEQTHRLENLVSDLLVLSSLESKEIKMSMGSVDIGALLQAVVLMQKKNIERNKHAVHVNVPPDLPKVYADQGRLEQVFLNLLDNAVKFTPAPGRIDIDACLEGGFLRVDVRDTGVGIPAEHLSRVFARFYRVDQARSSDLGGTRLGLSIVKHIVNAHKGRVEVQSQIGSVSTFRVFLPVDNSPK